MATRKLTRKRRRLFLEKLEASGNISAAARHAGLNRQALYEARDADHGFSAEWDEAELRFFDAAASEHARRALVGDERVRSRVTRTVKPDGSVVEERVEERITVKSDRLLAHLLDRRHPVFRAAAARREVTGEGGGPVNFSGLELVIVDPADPPPIE